MTQPPVTLAELNDFLNVTDSSAAGDEERWGRLLAATEMVEQRVGAMRIRAVTETVRARNGVLELTAWPILDVTSVELSEVPVTLSTLDVDDVAGTICAETGPRLCGKYVVEFTVGRVDIPAALSEATLVVAEQLYQSQRGPSAALKYTPTGSESAPLNYPRGFAWPSRALELIDPYDDLGIA